MLECRHNYATCRSGHTLHIAQNKRSSYAVRFAGTATGHNNGGVGSDKLCQSLRLVKVNFRLCHLLYIIKTIIMELYKLGSLLLDISIGVLVLGVIIRLILTYRYFKINGSKTLNDSQKNTIKKVRYPIAIIALLTGIAALILFFV